MVEDRRAAPRTTIIALRRDNNALMWDTYYMKALEISCAMKELWIPSLGERVYCTLLNLVEGGSRSCVVIAL